MGPQGQPGSPGDPGPPVSFSLNDIIVNLIFMTYLRDYKKLRNVAFSLLRSRCLLSTMKITTTNE